MKTRPSRTPPVGPPATTANGLPAVCLSHTNRRGRPGWLGAAAADGCRPTSGPRGGGGGGGLTPCPSSRPAGGGGCDGPAAPRGAAVGGCGDHLYPPAVRGGHGCSQWARGADGKNIQQRDVRLRPLTASSGPPLLALPLRPPPSPDLPLPHPTLSPFMRHAVLPDLRSDVAGAGRWKVARCCNSWPLPPLPSRTPQNGQGRGEGGVVCRKKGGGADGRGRAPPQGRRAGGPPPQPTRRPWRRRVRTRARGGGASRRRQGRPGLS